jgi:LmbE family N-acetylglucosaminyl deacetylase
MSSNSQSPHPGAAQSPEEASLGPGSGILVVVAHPDDEILWLGPAVAKATTIIAALATHYSDPKVTRGRELVRASYPGPFEFLGLRSAGVYRRSDWRRRSPVEHGVTLEAGGPPERAALYEENYRAMLELLDPYVRRNPVIYTHNPWGEYGHEEHVQVSKAVQALAKRHGCTVWAWDGFQEQELLRQGMRLRSDYFAGRTASLPSCALAVDSSLYREVRQLYLSNDAWTWDDLYEPPPVSNYLQLVRQGEVLLTPRMSPHWSRPARIVGRAAIVSAGRARRMLIQKRSS